MLLARLAWSAAAAIPDLIRQRSDDPCPLTGWRKASLMTLFEELPSTLALYQSKRHYWRNMPVNLNNER